MENVKYSILVPLYNKKESLMKYFSRITSQSFDNYEVVVLDDASTDGSYEYLKENYENINLIRNNENRGLGYTRNILINNAKGKYILFVDPDDYIEIDLLKEIDKKIGDFDILRFQNVIVPMTPNRIAQEIGKDKYRYGCKIVDNITGEEALLKWCLGERNINTFPWTYAIKKDLYNGIQYPELNNLEDFAITPYLIAKAEKIKAIPYVGYHYLLYDNSLSNSDNNLRSKIKKLQTLYYVVQMAIFNINSTNISNESKKIYIDDVINRYNIRKEKIDSLLEDKKVRK